MEKSSYKLKGEKYKALLTNTIVEKIVSGNFKTYQKAREATKDKLMQLYHEGKTFDMFPTEYHIDKNIAEFLLNLDTSKELLKSDLAINALEELNNNSKTFKEMEKVPQKNDDSKIIIKLFRHFAGKQQQPLGAAIESITKYLKENRPDISKNSTADISIVIMGYLYKHFLKMKEDPKKFVLILLNELSKDDLKSLLPEIQSKLV